MERNSRKILKGRKLNIEILCKGQFIESIPNTYHYVQKMGTVELSSSFSSMSFHADLPPIKETTTRAWNWVLRANYECDPAARTHQWSPSAHYTYTFQLKTPYVLSLSLLRAHEYLETRSEKPAILDDADGRSEFPRRLGIVRAPPTCNPLLYFDCLIHGSFLPHQS